MDTEDKRVSVVGREATSDNQCQSNQNQQQADINISLKKNDDNKITNSDEQIALDARNAQIIEIWKDIEVRRRRTALMRKLIEELNREIEEFRRVDVMRRASKFIYVYIH